VYNSVKIITNLAVALALGGDFTDIDGHRSRPSPPAAPKAARSPTSSFPRRRARCEDRIRWAKDTGLRNLPDGYDQNKIWCEITALACELRVCAGACG
jgi:hypothetical protein